MEHQLILRNGKQDAAAQEDEYVPLDCYSAECREKSGKVN